jgi:uncharacterized surface protein with fasciclin (FAS1) repeats
MRPVRNRTARTNRAAEVSAIAAGLALTAAACGSSGSAASAASPSHHPMASHSPMNHPTSSVFGSDCGMVPSSGVGSLHSMSMEPVAAAAAHNPLLSDLSRAIKGARLSAELNSMRALTIFAPADTAFSGVHGPAMTLLHNPAELTRILKYHVVAGSVTPARLAAGKPLTTLEGGTLKPSKMGAVYEVNKADVICGNIQTANATVYIISKVLIPMH